MAGMREPVTMLVPALLEGNDIRSQRSQCSRFYLSTGCRFTHENSIFMNKETACLIYYYCLKQTY